MIFLLIHFCMKEGVERSSMYHSAVYLGAVVVGTELIKGMFIFMKEVVMTVLLHLQQSTF